MSTQRAVEQLEKRFNRLVGTSATNLCTRCGWCIESCHVYRATKDPSHTPVAKTERVRAVLRRRHDWLSRILPGWTGARDLTEEELVSWVELAYRNCTLCERCVVNCPMAVETPQIIGAVRGTLTSLGMSPEILGQLADSALARQEMFGDMEGFLREQMADLEPEVQALCGKPDARIPILEPAELLYVPLSGSHTIVPPAAVFETVGASWSMSLYDAANYGLFLGDVPRAKKIVSRLIDDVEKVGAKELVVTECGHAYGVLKWEAPKWFGGPLPFKVTSLVERIDGWIRDGSLTLHPSRNSAPVTYHDPCNMGRKGGIFDEPRRVLQAACADYREMTPGREQNYCCGGGGGMVANLDWEEFRIQAGHTKGEQVRATGAEVVVTSCDNCLHQIKEVGEQQDLGITVSNVTQLVANALLPSSP